MTPIPKEIPGIELKLKLKDKNNNPIADADVELHSKPVYSKSDKDGNVIFKNVEPGQHTLKIAKGDYLGEQSLNLSDKKAIYEINITLEPQDKQMTITLGVVIGTSITLLVVVILRFVFKNKFPF